MPTVFVSYREDDAKAWAVAVRDALAERFGADEVFLDKESLQAGRWREQIEAQLAVCKVFIVVIGRRWLGATDAQGHIRLQQADDVHRREVAAALARPQVTVIPLLVDGATWPGAADLPDDLRGLTEQQARRLHDTETHRSLDWQTLAIDVVHASGLRDRGAASSALRRFRLALLGSGAVLLVGAGTYLAHDRFAMPRPSTGSAQGVQELSRSASQAAPPLREPASTATKGDAPASADLAAILTNMAPPLPDATTPHPELGFDVVALRAGTSAFDRLPDGAELASEVDDYLIVATPFTDGYLYVFQLDAAGRVQWLFPANDTSPFSSGRDPVRAGSTVTVPEVSTVTVPGGSGGRLYLDTTEGIESVYAVLSATPWPDLEAALRAVALPVDGSVAPRQELLSGSRGVGGIRKAPAATTTGPAAVARIEGRVYPLPAPVELVQAAGHFVAVKRWFRHVADPQTVPGRRR